MASQATRGEVTSGTDTLRWSETGDGPALVLLHSGGLSSRQWSRHAAPLAEGGFRVLTPDLLGYGESSPWPDAQRFHYLRDALAVEALVDALGAPVHLVGHSYGGFLALLVALHRRRTVRSVVAFEPVSFGVLRPVEDADAIATLASADLDTPWPLDDAALEAWLTRFVDYWNAPGAFAQLAPPVRDAFRRAGRKLYGEVTSLADDRTPQDVYALLDVPALVLAGARSTIAARRVAQRLGEVLPNGRSEEVAGVGHMGPLEDSVGFVARVIAQLERAR